MIEPAAPLDGKQNAVPRTAANVAIIPARAGSKRLFNKNTRLLHGRPMLEYTVEAALMSWVFDRVIVSTDSDAIARIAISAGAEVPFLRVPHLADDNTHVSAVALDALTRVDPRGHVYERVAVLMPNCPLRTAEDVRDSHDYFVAHEAGAQLSVARFGFQNPWWAMRRSATGELTPVHPAYATQRSQDLPELLCPTGAIWWARTPTLREHGTFHIPGRTGWELSWTRAMDIDTADDFALAELLMAQRLEAEVPRGA